MNIQISDLPNGRQVKKITFDIEFEDGLPVEVTIGSIPDTVKMPEPTPPKGRIKKEHERPSVPKEMLDEEF